MTTTTDAEAIDRQAALDTESTDAAEPGNDTETAKADPLAALTVAELSAGSRHIKADLLSAITQRTEHYADALAVVLWLHRRRHDRSTPPAQLLDQLRALPFTELSDQLDQLATELAATEAGPTGRPRGSS